MSGSHNDPVSSVWLRHTPQKRQWTVAQSPTIPPIPITDPSILSTFPPKWDENQQMYCHRPYSNVMKKSDIKRPYGCQKKKCVRVFFLLSPNPLHKSTKKTILGEVDIPLIRSLSPDIPRAWLFSIKRSRARGSRVNPSKQQNIRTTWGEVDRRLFWELELNPAVGWTLKGKGMGETLA